MKEILLYIWRLLLIAWQLPQWLLGRWYVWHGGARLRGAWRGIPVYLDDSRADRYGRDCPLSGYGGGEHIVLYEWRAEEIPHEGGHCLQSRMLGWLYLPVAGIASGLNNLKSRKEPYRSMGRKEREAWYYGLYPEKWADELGGIKRDWGE